MRVRHPKALQSVSVVNLAPARKLLFTVFVTVLYAAVFHQVYSTMGEPRVEAIAQANELRIKKLHELAEEQSIGDDSVGEADDDKEEDSVGGFVEADWSDESTDEDTTKGEDDDERPLPSPYLPSAFSCAALFLLMSFHALFHLMCHWSVPFKASALFSSATEVREGAYVQVIPSEHRGKPALAMLISSHRTGRLTFEFQRQKYEYYADHELRRLRSSATEGGTGTADFDDLVGESGYGAVRLIKCPMDSKLGHYTSARGLKTPEDVSSRTEHFGQNVLDVKQAKFHELLIQQLLSPISVFQIFCSLLWLLDAYWQYCVFTVMSIGMLESTSAFQRLKTLGTLKGMSSKAYYLKVYRQGRWQDMLTEQLLPGDLISLCGKRVAPKPIAPAEGAATGETAGAAGAAAGAKAPGAKQPNVPMRHGQQMGVDIVPCDCLLLQGSAVVNESTLTGESVPQMKDALVPDSKEDEERSLDMDGRDRVSCMFSGTTIVSAGARAGSGVASDGLPKTPDGGCLCYVLRTGFSSSQGELVQLIEFSQEKVSADSKEVFIALFLLLIFALVAAAYVMKEGLAKGDRTTHELLLKCVIIITSVVPRQLPVQMAMAVNQALMSLTKNGIFCTEPYRVPFAGKVSHCLFDKTGTITTDTLVPVGVTNARAGSKLMSGSSVVLSGLQSLAKMNGMSGVVVENQDKETKRYSVRVAEDDEDRVVAVKAENLTIATDVGPDYVAMGQAASDAVLVLSSCHALTFVEGTGLIGDPIELAAMRGVGWRYDATSGTCLPGRWEENEKGVEVLKKKLESMQDGQAAKAELQDEINTLQAGIREAKERAEKSEIRKVEILHRYHFSSALQRMSVVVNISSVNASFQGKCCLVKGSPEAIQKLLSDGAKPSWYENTYRSLSERGFRVLALAYKMSPDMDVTSAPDRVAVEADLTFAGFVAFECKTRGDSPVVITALEEADLRTAMLTGDAPLTALHVARDVGMCTKTKEALTLTIDKEASASVMWAHAVGGATDKLPFDVDAVGTLADEYELMTTEAALEYAVEQSGGEDSKIWDVVQYIKVFARMSPNGKAKVLRAMQMRNGHHVLMCGDGGNDVGALKQADVGVALLGGFGNNMIGKGDEGDEDEDADDKEGEAVAEERLNEQQAELGRKARESAAVRKSMLGAKQKELAGLQQQWMQEELAAREARGEDTGFMGNMQAVKTVTFRMKNELQAYQMELNRKHGNVYDKPEDVALSEMGDAMQMIRPGDASVAAPFTSRTPSIRCCVDLLRQGRCTLLSALQQQQIMMLECMISAYTLSALSLEGARSSERQLMASSWLIMTASLSFSYATPVKQMDRVRPLRSLFHPAIFISILGQAVIHLGCMIVAVNMATEAMGPEKLKEVKQFHLKVKAGEEVELNEDDPLAEIMALWSTPFLPNLLNTVIFLVETAQVRACLTTVFRVGDDCGALLMLCALWCRSLQCFSSTTKDGPG
jgi:cation-transporting ATPase 13A1